MSGQGTNHVQRPQVVISLLKNLPENRIAHPEILQGQERPLGISRNALRPTIRSY